MGESALRFGRYEALFRIASGGMAEVFAARVRGEGGFEKLVAVKRMLPHLAEDPEFVRMFLDEARVAAHLTSANVVQTLDIGRTDDGALYIVMELVLGLSLAELLPLALKSGHVPVAVCVEVLAQVAMGLHDAHEARTAAGELLGLVHRDVSPQNVLIGLDGRARLTDFGIARVSESRRADTQHGTIKGKFAYFSPEQSRGATLDRRSDVFALGIVAWEMLAGRRLFARTSPTDTVEAIRNGDIPHLDRVRPGLPPALTEAVHRALERPIDGRWRTARDMAEALRESLGSAGSAPAVVASFVQRLRAERIVQLEARVREAVASPEVRTLPDIVVADSVDDATIVDDEERPVTEARTVLHTRRSRSKGALLALGIASVVVVTAGIVLSLGSEEPAPSPEPVAQAESPIVEAASEPAPVEPLREEPQPDAAEPTEDEPIADAVESAPEPRARKARARRPRARRTETRVREVERPPPPPAPTTMRLRAGQVLGVPEGL